MAHSQKHFLFSMAIALVLGFSLSIWHFQTADAQTKPLTYPEINTALNSKLPNKVFKNKSQLVNWLITQIKQRRVDKALTDDRREDLLQAGATDELIEIIRQNSPPLRAQTPASTPTPSRTLPNSNDSKTLKNSIRMEFVSIPSGSFMMGSDNGDANEKPVHRVIISKSFWMGKTEVTQKQWEAVMGQIVWKGPVINGMWKFYNDDYPMMYIDWNDTQEFIRKLNAKGEGTYRLPTEAEWEYAARAGTTGDYAGDLKAMAWCSLTQTEYRLNNVATKQPNNWGLYDMFGNVSEIVQDWYGNYPSENITDPTGTNSGLYRVVRGGDVSSDASDLRSAYRFAAKPTESRKDRGFRIVREK